MFCPVDPQEKRWSLEELEARLGCKFLEQRWKPFVNMTDEDPNLRIVAIADHAPLGRGTFGVVYAAAMSLPPRPDEPTRYVPAAMKLLISTDVHATELANALSLNDIVTAGVSPCVTRLIDAFTVSGQRRDCSMPPDEWTGFWKTTYDFVDSNVPKLRSLYGSEMPKDAASVLDCIRSKGSLCFQFTELAWDAKHARHEPYSTRLSPATTSPNFLRASVAVPDPRLSPSRPLLVDMWQRVQVVAALHETGALHGDIHPNNFVVHAASDLRTSFCRLASKNSDAELNSYYGVSGKERPADVFFDHGTVNTGRPRFYAVPRNPYSACDPTFKLPCVRIEGDEPFVTLIDCGTVINGVVPRDALAADVRRQWKSSAGDLPVYVISDNPLKYDPKRHEAALGLAHGPSGLPLMYAKNRRTAALFARAPEILNPRTDPSGTIPPFHPYSELSDVFSLATCLVSQILGFHPFGSFLLINSRQNPKSLGISATHVSKSGAKRAGYRLDVPGFERSCTLEPQQKYEKTPPSSFNKARVSGDHWVVGNPAPSHRLAAVLMASRKEMSEQAQQDFDNWIGDTDEVLTETAVTLVARIFAIGSPPSKDIRATALGRHIVDENLDNVGHGGWLRPTLLKVLTKHYCVQTQRAVDFVDLVCDALSWDPAQRPMARDLLRCSIFRDLYVDVHDQNITLSDIWSCEPPTASGWESGNGGWLSPSAVPRHSQVITPLEVVPYSVYAREYARPIVSLRQRRATHHRLPGFHTSRRTKALYLCPYQSYLAFHFNFERGALDMYDAAPRLSISEGTSKTYSAPTLRGKFRKRGGLHKHLEFIEKVSARLPFWLPSNDEDRRGSKRPRSSSGGSPRKKRQKTASSPSSPTPTPANSRGRQ